MNVMMKGELLIKITIALNLLSPVTLPFFLRTPDRRQQMMMMKHWMRKRREEIR